MTAHAVPRDPAWRANTYCALLASAMIAASLAFIGGIPWFARRGGFLELLGASEPVIHTTLLARRLTSRDLALCAILAAATFVVAGAAAIPRSIGAVK